MSTYLLLRSNKQTGPFTLDEVREMGLKAYDLVWVEGKSAAWRYPGEVEEFKSFAPLVEEQPFDRFFKRPVQTNQPLFTTTSSQTSTAREERMVSVPVKKEMEPMVQPARPVYSTPPTGIVSARGAEIKNNIGPREPIIVFEQDLPQQKELKEASPKIISPLPALSASSPVTEDYSQGYQERKMNFEGKNKQPVKNTSSFGGFLKPFAIGFGLASFLGIGIFIGITITNRGNNASKEIARKDDNAANDGGTQHALYRPTDMPLVTPPNQGSETDKNLQSNNLPQRVDAVVDNNATIEKKKAKNKQKQADSLTLLKPKPAVDSSALLATQKIARAAESAVLAKENVKNNIINYVGITGNKYNVGTFGGISDLQLTISNKSLYPLDLVMVEVQYIQSNKKVFKRENLYFRNIGAGSALMQEAPKSSRGVSVQYRITVINSKELGLSYTGI